MRGSMTVGPRGPVPQRIGIRVWDTGVAEADFLTTAKGRVERGVEGIRFVAGQVDDGSERGGW